MHYALQTAYKPIFPSELQPIGLTFLPTLEVGEEWPAQQGFEVIVQSQTLSVPSRVIIRLACYIHKLAV
jgi:hypothetical protein